MAATQASGSDAVLRTAILGRDEKTQHRLVKNSLKKLAAFPFRL
jgi:hypothetical protein